MACMTASAAFGPAASRFSSRTPPISRYDAVTRAKGENTPIMPAVKTPTGPLDLSTIYLNCPGGSVYSVLASYYCMSWKIHKMSAAFTGQHLEATEKFIERDPYFSAAAVSCKQSVRS